MLQVRERVATPPGKGIVIAHILSNEIRAKILFRYNIIIFMPYYVSFTL